MTPCKVLSLRGKRSQRNWQKQHRQVLSWAEVFFKASPEETKIITSAIIKEMILGRGCKM